MEAKAQQGFCLDPLAPAGRSELTSSLSGSPCLEQTLALMHFERGSECQIDPVMLTKSEPYLLQIETCGSAYVLVDEMFAQLLASSSNLNSGFTA